MRFLQNIITGIAMCLLELSTNIRRTLLTTLGIFFGVTSLLINLAFARAIKDDVETSMVQVGGLDILTIRAIKPDNQEEKLAFRRSPGLTHKTLETIAKDLPAIKGVLKSSRDRWRKLYTDNTSKWGRTKGIEHSYFSAFQYKLAEGRYFTQGEEQNGSAVALIGPEIAERLFGSSEAALEEVILSPGGHRFVVKGVLDAPFSSERSNELFFPYGYYQKKFQRVGEKSDEVQVQIENPKEVRAVQRLLRQKVLAAHRGVEDFEIEASLDKMKEMEQASMALDILLQVIAFITLLIGGVTIMNIMFATIGNRLREIGVRKAMGARSGDIFLQFIIEALTISLVGAFPGILIGSLVTFAPEGVFPFTPRLTLQDYLLALSFTMGMGLISGLFPAFKAARMEVVEALRQ